MTDLLPALLALRDAAPRDSAERDTLTRAVVELERRARPLVRVKRVGSHDLPLPAYATDGAAGMDLRADLSRFEPGRLSQAQSLMEDSVCLVVPNGGRALIPCGFAFEIPEGFEGQVRGRSSLTKRGIYCPTGTIDHDYRGEVAVYIDNRSGEPFQISAGDRIAQLVIAPAPQVRLEEAMELSETARGTAGFGSTGVR